MAMDPGLAAWCQLGEQPIAVAEAAGHANQRCCSALVESADVALRRLRAVGKSSVRGEHLPAWRRWNAQLCFLRVDDDRARASSESIGLPRDATPA